MPVSTFSNIIIQNHMPETGSFFTGGDWITMIVCIFTMFYSIWNNNRTINAEIKSKSRIEWIESIRKTTSDLLSNYHLILRAHNFLSDEEERINSYLCEANRLTQLLILHFSDDSEIKKVMIDNKTTNDGKNSVLVEYISKVFDSFFKFYHGIFNLDKKIDRISNRIIQLEKEISDGYYMKKYEDDDGNEFEGMSSEDIDKLTDSIIAKEQRERNLEKLINKKKNLYIMLDKLSKSIRVYGKIEWEKAKKIK